MNASEFAELPATATRGALTIEYRWVGVERADVPITVFLHEGLGSVAMWRDWPQALCERLGMRGLVWSRPGYGRSTPRPHDLKWPVDFMSHQARDVFPALLDVLGVSAAQRERMWVIGHSDGGSIALLYAAFFPHALAGAVVVAPHVFVEDLSVKSIAEVKLAFETTNLRDKLARYHDDVDSAFYGWSDIWLNPSFRDWNIVDQLGTLRAPLLTVQALDDHYGTMAQVEAIGAAVPHARVHTLAAGGHSPHRDVTQVLDDAIAQFVLEPR